MKLSGWKKTNEERLGFIGGSDAKIIMGEDETALLRLWREKRGEIEPEDLSDNLIVQLGCVTEDLNRRWYERNTGHAIKDVQRRLQHPVHNWMAAPWMASSNRAAQCLRQNSCCPGRSRRKLPPKSTWRSCSTICGSRSPIGGAFDHHGRWQMGGNVHSSRPALPAPPPYRREKILAMRSRWRAPSPVRGRAASPAAPGHPGRGHEHVQ